MLLRCITNSPTLSVVALGSQAWSAAKSSNMEYVKDDDDDDIINGRLSALMPRQLFSESDAAVKKGILQVYVRMKPLKPGAVSCMHSHHGELLKATWKSNEALYKFSRVFEPSADQQQVYSASTHDMVQKLLDGDMPSAVVMAYGVTSAGKTFTCMGTPSAPGLVPQALKHIFKEPGAADGSLRVFISVYEIYNENIQELLAPPGPQGQRPCLRLKEDKAGHMGVVGAQQAPVHNATEALQLLRKAAKARQSAETAANARSSRSHAVFTIMLERTGEPGTAEPGTAQAGGAQRGSSPTEPGRTYLHFVDLAGCERVKRTGNSGARLKESVAINSSLMTLARCLEVLRYNQQHPGDQRVIPYRESKITYLFKDVLHGLGRFVLMVNVSPDAAEFNETKRVLQYAALASKIVMTSQLAPAALAAEAAAAAAAATAACPNSALAPASAAAAAAQQVEELQRSLSAARAALSASQGRVEELLDDKADLEYDVDVLERKLELLREELVKAEVEKEEQEEELRQELAAELQQLLEAKEAAHRAAAAAAAAAAQQKEEQATAERARLAAAVEELQQQLAAEQQQKRDLQAALMTSLPASAHEQGLQLLMQQHAAELELVRGAAAAQVAEAQAAAATLQQEVQGLQKREQEQQQAQLRCYVKLEDHEQQMTELQEAHAQELQQQREYAAAQLEHEQSQQQQLLQAVAQQMQAVTATATTAAAAAGGGSRPCTAAAAQVQALPPGAAQQLRAACDDVAAAVGGLVGAYKTRAAAHEASVQQLQGQLGAVLQQAGQLQEAMTAASPAITRVVCSMSDVGAEAMVPAAVPSAGHAAKEGDDDSALQQEGATQPPTAAPAAGSRQRGRQHRAHQAAAAADDAGTAVGPEQHMRSKRSGAATGGSSKRQRRGSQLSAPPAEGGAEEAAAAAGQAVPACKQTRKQPPGGLAVVQEEGEEEGEMDAGQESLPMPAPPAPPSDAAAGPGRKAGRGKRSRLSVQPVAVSHADTGAEQPSIAAAMPGMEEEGGAALTASAAAEAVAAAAGKGGRRRTRTSLAGPALCGAAQGAVQLPAAAAARPETESGGDAASIPAQPGSGASADGAGPLRDITLQQQGPLPMSSSKPSKQHAAAAVGEHGGDGERSLWQVEVEGGAAKPKVLDTSQQQQQQEPEGQRAAASAGKKAHGQRGKGKTAGGLGAGQQEQQPSSAALPSRRTRHKAAG